MQHFCNKFVLDFWPARGSMGDGLASALRGISSIGRAERNVSRRRAQCGRSLPLVAFAVRPVAIREIAVKP